MNAVAGLTLALVALAALALGGGWPRRFAGRSVLVADLPLAFAAGALALHVAFAAATLLGAGWSRALALAALVAGALAWRAARLLEPTPGSAPGPGAWAAGGVGALVVALGSAGWLTQPDFYYHWGLKARRFLEIGGADYYFLAGPSAWRFHPDYPLLGPELLMLPSLVAGSWSERGALALSALVVALLFVALRGALAAAGLAAARLEVATAVGAALFGGFVVGYGLVGAADPLLALALLLALPALASDREPTAALSWRLGIGAALAAASKIEGVPLALWIVGVDAATRTLRSRRLPPFAHLARTALPTLVVVLPWFALARVYRLFLETNAGSWRWERATEIFPAVVECALHPDWAFAPLLLVALPFVVSCRRLAPAAAVVALQLALYFAVYFTGPVETRFYVLSTLPRLLFHLLPATFALVAGRFFGDGGATWPTDARRPESAR
ncbi:MAG: hypothetical protein H6511_02135 [Holophagales bacterium]|nr:hypothetical protein [Holophagales bacterium]